MYGPFWKNVLGYWKQRNLPNVFIIKFEDMKSDLPSVINKIADFLGKTISEDQMKLLCEHLSFKSMRDNYSVNFEYLIEANRKANLLVEDGRFARSGTVGKYKEELSAETIERIDTWIKNNISGTSFENESDFKL